MKLNRVFSKVYFLFIPLILLFLIPSIVESNEFSQHYVLASLDSLSVNVDITCNVDIPGFNPHMTQNELQTLCELELRKYGINLVSDGYAILYISFVFLYDGEALVSYSTITRLYEHSMPRRIFMGILSNSLEELNEEIDNNRELNDADSVHTDMINFKRYINILLGKYLQLSPLFINATWSLPLQVGTVGCKNLESTLERNVKAYIREFINDYLKANPKE